MVQVLSFWTSGSLLLSLWKDKRWLSRLTLCGSMELVESKERASEFAASVDIMFEVIMELWLSHCHGDGCFWERTDFCYMIIFLWFHKKKQLNVQSVCSLVSNLALGDWENELQSVALCGHHSIMFHPQEDVMKILTEALDAGISFQRPPSLSWLSIKACFLVLLAKNRVDFWTVHTWHRKGAGLCLLKSWFPGSKDSNKIPRSSIVLRPGLIVAFIMEFIPWWDRPG